MTLTPDDLEQIKDMFTEMATSMRVSRDGIEADDILPLIQNPNVRLYPGPSRSRYSQVTLLDQQDVPKRQLRVKTADIRTMLLNAFNDEPGEAIAQGEEAPTIQGPKGRG